MKRSLGVWAILLALSLLTWAGEDCPEGQLRIGENCLNPVFEVTFHYQSLLVLIRTPGGNGSAKAVTDASSYVVDAPTLEKPARRLVPPKDEAREYKTQGVCPAAIDDTQLSALLETIAASLREETDIKDKAAQYLFKRVNNEHIRKSKSKSFFKEPCDYVVRSYRWTEQKQLPLTAEQRLQMKQGEDLKPIDDETVDQIAKEIENRDKDRQKRRMEWMLRDKDPRQATPNTDVSAEKSEPVNP